METFRIPVGDSATVSGVLEHPDTPRAVYLLAHGAGAGMNHEFMTSISGRLADRHIACVRFNFPYTEAGRSFPDRAPILEQTVRAAVAATRERLPNLPLIAGGKSMGGRMSSRAAADGGLDGVRGIAFLGFPLHPPPKPAKPGKTVRRKPTEQRADHLRDVAVPMLFLQGTRDKLADLDKLRPVCESLGDRATLHVVEGADHGFHVLKRSGRTDAEVLDELADTVSEWAGRHLTDSVSEFCT